MGDVFDAAPIHEGRVGFWFRSYQAGSEMTLDEFRIEPEVSEAYWEGLATGALRCSSHRGGPVWGKARRRQRLSRSTKVQTAGTAHSGTPGRYHGRRCRARR